MADIGADVDDPISRLNDRIKQVEFRFRRAKPLAANLPGIVMPLEFLLPTSREMRSDLFQQEESFPGESRRMNLDNLRVSLLALAITRSLWRSCGDAASRRLRAELHRHVAFLREPS